MQFFISIGFFQVACLLLGRCYDCADCILFLCYFVKCYICNLVCFMLRKIFFFLFVCSFVCG